MAHVGDVHDTVHVVAGIAEILLQHVLHDVGAQVADVGKVIHRGAAGIHLHMARCMGDKFIFFMGGGIIQIHGHSPLYMLKFILGK